MNPAGAPNVHLSKPDPTIESPTVEAFQGALEEAGTREVRIVVVGKYAEDGTVFEIKELWRGEPQFEQTEDGMRWAGPVPREGLVRTIAMQAGMPYYDWKIRGQV